MVTSSEVLTEKGESVI